MATNAQPEHTFLELVWERPTLHDGQRVHVQKIGPLMLRRIDEFRVVAKCVVTVDRFPLRHGVMDRLKVAWGTGAILGLPAMVVATGEAGEDARVSLRVFSERPQE
jgi:hypothetical protein